MTTLDMINPDHLVTLIARAVAALPADERAAREAVMATGSVAAGAVVLPREDGSGFVEVWWGGELLCLIARDELSA